MKKILWKKLLVKAAEEAIKKTIELLVLALALGITARLIFVAVPAIIAGSVVAKVTKITLLE